MPLVAQYRWQKELIASLKEIKLETGFTFTPYAQIWQQPTFMIKTTQPRYVKLRHLSKQFESTVKSWFKKVHFFFLKSRLVWFKKDLCSESKNRFPEKNALCRWISNLRSFLNRDITVLLAPPMFFHLPASLLYFALHIYSPLVPRQKPTLHAPKEKKRLYNVLRMV